MTFQPIGTSILVEYMENNTNPSGLELPQGSTMDFSMFVVRAVGRGQLTASGTIVELPVKVGDMVQMKNSAVGQMVALPRHLVNDRKLATIDIIHVAGIWEGELPSPKVMRNILKPKMEMVH